MPGMFTPVSCLVICKRNRYLLLTLLEIQVEQPMVGGNKGNQLPSFPLTVEEMAAACSLYIL